MGFQEPIHPNATAPSAFLFFPPPATNSDNNTEQYEAPKKHNTRNTVASVKWSIVGDPRANRKRVIFAPLYVCKQSF